VFLSGVFFSLGELSASAREVACLNPVFYVVDGIRFGLTGYGEADLRLAAVVSLGVVIILWSIAYRLFTIGYRFKS